MKHKKRFVTLIFGLGLFVLVACSPRNGTLPETGTEPSPAAETPTIPAETPAAETPAAEDPLVNTQWTLVSFEEAGAETTVLPATQPGLQFDENGQAGGSGGCNSFGTQYQVQDGQVTFGQVTSTMMACTDEGVMEQESRYLLALQSAGTYELAGDSLRISYNNGQGTLSFSAAQSETP
jgi:putative lipoprotein